jgi:hypothetical protein
MLKKEKRLAQTYSELFDDVKVAQAKFDEVLIFKRFIGIMARKNRSHPKLQKRNKNQIHQYVPPNITSGFLSQKQSCKAS